MLSGLDFRIDTGADAQELILFVAGIPNNIGWIALQVGVDSRVDDIDQVGIDVGGTDRRDMTSLDRFNNSIGKFS